ncbi:DUF1592 domain-containing protein [Adhaeretor mobilis]|uniref:DUF1592 domain-containing protein n=1 Tax=Adhaeretor mobilis TaxID=1930276 RepID=A0A517N2B3_9BACT|nr:DUF1592 domain-containing protein [Adhaeretor mobilis]QDT01261.1 hypothetical protein HG15A2_46030 [Adhaeretor mobilis]
MHIRCFILFIAFSVPLVAEAQENHPALEPRAAREHVLTPLLESHCYDCHSGEEAEAGVALDQLNDAGPLLGERRTWLRVLNRLRDGSMPPEEYDQPAADERQQVSDWLDAELHSLDCSQPQSPGRVTLRRLNRAEYANTVRDLTGVTIDVQEIFPRDELGYGFDNNGDVLSLSPLLLEKYLVAAEQISAEAISAPESILKPSRQYMAGQLRGGQLIADNTRLLSTNGAIQAKVNFPKQGRYFLRVRCYATQAGDTNELAEMRVELGGQALSVLGVAAAQDDPHTYVIPLDAQKGKQTVSVKFTNDFYHPDAVDESRRDRNLFVLSLTVVGPVEKQKVAAGDTLLTSAPTPEQWRSPDAWQPVVRTELYELVSKAFRRPATDDEVNRYLKLVGTSHERGDSYGRAMQTALQGVLVSPKFLFRDESPTDGGVDKDKKYRLNDHQLATRLSYFLTLSMPDQEMRRLADQGKLYEQLHQQVNRLLEGDRSDAFLRHFGEQWLETRRLENLERDKQAFPDYDPALAQSMRDETFLFLRDMLSTNKPLSSLLSSDESYLDARLAKHYGVVWPVDAAPDSFQRLRLPEERRGGLLTQGSVLSVVSLVDRTSPVLRGKWILDHLLNDPPADPPPGVSDLAKQPAGEKPQSLRAQLELHRADPGCATCHIRMDPLGFALENFDALGAYRELENNQPIDVSGKLPDGRELTGALGLQEVLLEDFDVVRRALAAQLLTYALGRGLEYHDECAVNEIAEATKQNDDNLAAMIHAVVDSAPFQQREDVVRE